MADPYAVGSVLAPIAGGLFGQSAASGERSAANEAYRRALREIAGIDIPTIESQRLEYLLPEYLEEYTPELEQAIEVEPTAMEDIAVDPRLKEAQMDALQQLTQRSEEGFTAEDQALMDIARRQAAGEAQAKQEQILQNLAQRGMAGSGQEIMARIQSSQQSANQLADQLQREMLAKQQARQQAALQAGQLGGDIRGQEFGEQADVARAKDVINRFATQMQSGQQQRNVGATNVAAQQNIAEKQRLAEQRAQLQNIQQERNKALLQQEFENRMKKGTAMAGMHSGQADRRSQQAGSVAQNWANIGTGVGEAIGAFGGKK